MVRAKALQIHWHSKQPIYSVDFHPQNPLKLATCGGDNNIRLWNLKERAPEASGESNELDASSLASVAMLSSSSSGELSVEYLTTLSKHLKTVNCVRFSPCGEVLASGGDGGVVILWRECSEPPSAASRKAFGEDSEDENDDDADLEKREYWQASNVFRVSDGEDVYDLSWSADGRHVLVGLTDNSAQVWDVSLQRCIRTLRDHQHFVQGVAWDPFDQLLVTQSADRSVKVWAVKPKWIGNSAGNGSSANPGAGAGTAQLNASGSASTLGPLTFTGLAKYLKSEPASTQIELQTHISAPLFHDETLVSFFRRPAFSPDGTLLVMPAGISSQSASSEGSAHGVYVNLRGTLNRPPIGFIGGFEKAATAVRFNPRLFSLVESPGPSDALNLRPWLALPYRLVFAVVTQNAVYVLDTQHERPLLVLKDFHYASLTDAAWSSDGCRLVVSSVDGFCTVLDVSAGAGDEMLGSRIMPRSEEVAVFDRLRSAARSVPFFNTFKNRRVSEAPLVPLSMHDEPLDCMNTVCETSAMDAPVAIAVSDPPVIHNPPVKKRRITPTTIAQDSNTLP